MREKTIEQKLVQAVKAKGGIAPKFVSPGFSGVPDRLILLPDGKCGFVEVKVSAAGVKDTAFAAAGVPGICPGWREPDPAHPFRDRR